MNVLALTRYGTLGPSTRVRFSQFIPALAQRGITVDLVPLLGNPHLRRLYAGQPRHRGAIAGAYVRRALAARSHRRDLVWIEKELLPYLPARAEEFLLAGRPYVLDYDDATFHTYDRHSSPFVRRALSHKVKRLMRGAAAVVVGNEYLAAYAHAAGADRVCILPSVVDIDRYGVPSAEPAGPFTVGWLGSPGSERLLDSIKPVLAAVAADPDSRVVLVGASPSALSGVPHETWPWSEATEAASIESFHVGIMPLNDTPWERGKCGFKLIQYMAAGRSVVASPVGANAQIVVEGQTGLLATSSDDWRSSLEALRQEPERRAKMGAMGRTRAEVHYSTESVAPKLAALLRHAGES